MIQAFNDELRNKYENNAIQPQTLLDSYMPLAKHLSCPSESWLRMWKSCWGWSTLARGGDQQAWLPFSSPDMAAARRSIRGLFESKQVHRFLLLNYDQLWRCCFSAGKTRMCYKDRQGAGRRVIKKPPSMKVDKKMHSIKGGRQSVTVSLDLQRLTSTLTWNINGLLKENYRI